MIDLQKLQSYTTDLTVQREQLLIQLHMLDGALQLCRQMIDEVEADKTASTESVQDVKEVS